MTKKLLALTAAGTMALALTTYQPAEAFVAGSVAADANRATQNDLSGYEEVRHHRRHHRHRHHRHNNWLWAAPLVAAPFLMAPRCERYWSRRYGWVQRCW